MRRGPASGRFLPTAAADAVPLFLRRPKSAPHLKGWGTRREKRAAWVKAHIEKMEAGR